MQKIKTLFLFLVLVFLNQPIGINAADVYEGTLETIIVESHDHPEDIHRLRMKDGSVRRLLVSGKFPYEPGTNLRIRAEEEGDNLVLKKVLTTRQKFSLVGSQGDANGSKRMLVLLVTDNDFAESDIPYSVAEIQDLFFGSSMSLSDYIDDTSSSKMNLAGDVIGTIGISNFCQSDNLFEHGADDDVLNAADQIVSDLSIYDFVTVVIPDRDDCLKDAAGIGTLGRLNFASKNGNLRLGINFSRSYNRQSFDNAFLGTVIHEFGHNLGLNHDNANSCGTEVFSSQACPGIEYGGGHSIMGLSPNMSHFNVIQKEDLGWLSSDEILTINNSSLNEDINLLPVSSTATGIKAIKVRREDGRYYYVEYRRPIGYDGILERDFNVFSFSGFLVYLDEESVGNRPLLMDSEFQDFRSISDLKTNSDGNQYYVNFDVAMDMHSRGLFSINETFNDTVSDIVISTSSLGSSAARITVNKGSADGSEDNGNDGSGLNLDYSFVDAVTLNDQINLKFKKKSKVLLTIQPDETKEDDFTLYTVKAAPAFKKLVKVNKKNKFDLFSGHQLRVKVAPEKVFFKRGLSVDSEGFYEVELLVQERSKFSSSEPQTLTLRVKASQ